MGVEELVPVFGARLWTGSLVKVQKLNGALLEQKPTQQPTPAPECLCKQLLAGVQIVIFSVV